MRILVIGEKCIDEFIYGQCTRLNPEAPTPVFIEKKRVENQGMAGNVAENLFSMGSIEVSRAHQKNPIRKTRYVDETSNYILLRVDSENDVDRIIIDDLLMDKIVSVDLVVVSDYDKGFLHPEDLRLISELSKASVIDTKKPIKYDWSEYFDFIKMNKSEWESPLHDPKAKNKMEPKTIITQGKHGAILNGKSYKGVEAEVMDVAGAGDSFLAGFAHKWLSSGDIELAIEFANEIAAYVVKKRGVVNQIF
jgi:D-beta-D-heptose 7-phosphate kinase/D-beta-D-heptose 1-phosphate adenosyltransferase